MLFHMHAYFLTHFPFNKDSGHWFAEVYLLKATLFLNFGWWNSPSCVKSSPGGEKTSDVHQNVLLNYSQKDSWRKYKVLYFLLAPWASAVFSLILSKDFWIWHTRGESSKHGELPSRFIVVKVCKCHSQSEHSTSLFASSFRTQPRSFCLLTNMASTRTRSNILGADWHKIWPLI